MTDEPAVDDQLLAIWRQVAAVGETLPSEAALADTLGVGRPLVREMLVRMEADGLIRRLQGAGTFANPGALDMCFRLDRTAEFSVLLAEAGYRSETEVRSVECLVLADAEAAILEARPGQSAIHIVKRWFADGRPVMLTTDVVPLRHPVDDLPDGEESVFDVANCHGLGSPDWLSTSVVPVNVDEATAELLELDVGTAVLALEQLGVDRFGQRVFHSFEHYHPDIVRFGLVRTVRTMR